jgi:hypothetical protein
MKYLSFVSGRERPMSEVPPGLFAAMEVHLAEELKKGHFISGGGLNPTSNGAFRVSTKDGKIVVTDGPFTEAKEVIGGFAFLAYDTKEEAIAATKRFMQLHLEHWPEWEGTSEVRPIMEGSEERDA